MDINNLKELLNLNGWAKFKFFEEISFFAKHSKINNNFKNYTEYIIVIKTFFK